MTGSVRTRRATIFLEDAEVLAHEAFAAQQYILRLKAPKCAAHAGPGSFAHLRCDPRLPMRRPLSLLRADPQAGWVEFLYKVVGTGTGLLAERRPGERISLLGPIGQCFQAHRDRPRALLLGGGVGIPPMVFLAECLHRDPEPYYPLVLMGSEVPFPFTTRPSRILVPSIPDGVIAALPLLEDWGVPSRLASRQGYPGCFDGYVTELARVWLQDRTPAELREVELFACGPHGMLEEAARLGAAFDVPCQVSLEEYMACAVGGCAGCVVRVQTETGPAMKRVCVDGPVFDARAVFPQ
ncbi:MAG: dihydroorotate dehydrogenase electron transfer subunit [Chromatiales bacterium 21-64-14]|nr:MAG: dihydroorotate dehydrogenase electron transfer subunit [Chromatiales bacterium 21-64-14]HQU15769.1 dihydroorotate dehydrogenase electron transfer subunit [Gammaproteobacteria bacterium]